jgi:cysteine-rich repeat protein
VIVLLLVFFTVYFQKNPFVVTNSDNEIIKLALPHYGSFKCNPDTDKLGLTINVPKDGALISKETVGFYTPGIKNIKLSFYFSYWSTDWGTRVRYAVCDANGNNCGAYTTKSDWIGGKNSIAQDSILFSQQSLRLIYERLPFYLLGGWQTSDGLQVSYDATPYKLVYYSTLQDPAGSTVCPTSCDLTCPDIGVRDKLIFTQNNTLGFDKTAPSFEYWETIDYDLNMQGGATVYNSVTNKFCFAGIIYTGTKTLMQNGITYIYPDVNTKQTKLCCPGATISATYSDKVCQYNYVWKTISDTDKLTCISDATCPGAGNLICQNKQLSNGYSCSDKDVNGVGLCKLASGSSVQCCLSTDCNKDMVCDSSSHTCKGGTIYPTCGNRLIESGEECDDGNTISGDGCSSTCQVEGDLPIQSNKCESCDAFVKSKTIGLLFPSQSCKPKGLLDLAIPQNNTTCVFSWLKLLAVPLAFILTLLFGINTSNKYKRKNMRYTIFGSTIIISLLVGYLLWNLFFIGIILAIVFLVASVLIKMFVPFR